MAGYTKLFGSIVFSTIWREEMHVKVVWVTMLALADQHGEIMASVPGLADASRVSIEQCEDALRKFMGPDPYSRTEDYGGQRVQKIEGGFLLLNYGKYRDEASKEHAARKHAERQARYRAKTKNVTSDGAGVTKTARSDAFVTESDPNAEAEAEAVKRAASCVGRDDQDGEYPGLDQEFFGGTAS